MPTGIFQSTLALSCRVCGTTGASTLYRAREMMFGTREEFDYFLCESCGCLQIKDIPAKLSEYYPSEYYSLSDQQPPRQASLSWLRSRLERARGRKAVLGKNSLLTRLAVQLVDLPPEVHLIGKLVKACRVRTARTRFLDVGCGLSSRWLRGLQAIGFGHLHGVDPFIPTNCNINGIRLTKGNLDSVVGQYDVISFNHSLEHIPEQSVTINLARRLLSRRGCLIIRIPLVSSLVWDMYGTDWVELDAPRHLYLHSHNSIRKLVEQHQLELIDIKWDSTEFEFYGSELYRRNIPLNADNSYWKNPNMSDFTFKEMEEFRQLANKANQERRGGRACFIFQA